ncbi:MAG: hypothetical protein KBD39_05490 [Sterolibacterium sp.]|nr:hypothetical protein [Sterolibacterium sp.]MBP9799555.1 hypothetical protein [Sterolibacterium sp.]
MREEGRLWTRGAVVLAALGLTACVTINIYFPAAAAEKMADKIIDEVWQAPKGGTAPVNVNTTTPQKEQP